MGLKYQSDLTLHPKASCRCLAESSSSEKPPLGLGGFYMWSISSAGLLLLQNSLHRRNQGSDGKGFSQEGETLQARDGIQLPLTQIAADEDGGYVPFQRVQQVQPADVGQGEIHDENIVVVPFLQHAEGLATPMGYIHFEPFVAQNLSTDPGYVWTIVHQEYSLIHPCVPFRLVDPCHVGALAGCVLRIPPLRLGLLP
jgi:hypothetical protein